MKTCGITTQVWLKGHNYEIAHINEMAQDGQIALIKACKEGNIEIVNALIALGAKTNVENKEGDTALTYCVKEGKTDFVEVLLKYQA